MATPGAEFATLGRKVPAEKAGDDSEAELRILEREISGNRDWPISSLLTQVVKRVSSITLATGAAIAVCDQWGVTCRASVGDAPEVGSRLQPDSGLTRECLESGRVVVCEDAESDYRVRRATAQNLQLRSALVVPLQNQGQVLGVIEVLSSRPSAFSPTHVDVLQRIAKLLADILAPTLPAPALTAIESARREDILEEGAPASSQPKLAAIATFPSAAPAGERKSKLSMFMVSAAGIVLLLVLWFRAGVGRRWSSHPSARTLPPAEIQSRAAVPNPTPEQPTTRSDNPGRIEPFHPELKPASRPASVDSASNPSAAPSVPVQKKTPLAGNAIESEAAPGTRSVAPGVRLGQPEIQSTAPMIRAAVPAIVIQGVPRGTQILVDNQVMASTDSAGQASISTMAPGRHHMRLRLNGYRDYEQDVDVQSEKTSTITAKLDPLELPAFSEPANSPVLAVNAVMPEPVLLARPSLPDFVLDRTLKAHDGWVTAVAFSPDGRRLVSGSWDRTVKFWEVSSGERLGTVANKMKEVQSLAFSRDGRWLATENSSDTASLRDPLSGQEIRTFPGDKALGPPGSNWVYSIAFSPDGTWLASAIDDKTVRLWDVNTGQKVRDLTGLRRTVVYIAFSPDGRLLATGDDQKNIRVWDAASGREIYKLSGHKRPVYAVAFSPDGRCLASASADKTVKIWDLATGYEVHTLAGHKNAVTSLAFSPDGHRLVSGSWDKTLKIWDVEAGREIQTLAGHDHAVYSVAFDPRGQWLASGSEDGTIKLWRSGGAASQGKSAR
jgi:WD40 repeat protein